MLKRLEFSGYFPMSLYVALSRHPLVAVISNHLDSYPTPINLSYM